MPELGSYGSVRGARGNSRPYRESGWPNVKATRLTLCGHIEIKTDRNGRDEKHCGSTTEVLLSP